MKKAFIILAHQLPQQLNIFIEQILNDPESEIFIHVNKLCESIIPEINASSERVHISKNNIAIHWGSDEILKAMLVMYREIINIETEYDYVLLCSAQDLMISSGLDSYLRRNYGKVIIEQCKGNGDFFDRYVRGRLLYKWPKLYRRKYDFRYHPVKIMRAIRYRYTLTGWWPFSKKKIDYDITGMKFYKDWQWSAMPIDIVKFIIDYMDKHPTYWSIYKDGYLPEECFITTLLHNNGLSDRILDTTFTYIKPMQNSHPPILTMSDINELEKSGKFFARKFDVRVDKDVIDYFRKKILNIQ